MIHWGFVCKEPGYRCRWYREHASSIRFGHAGPDARVVPTPFSPQRVVMAASTLGSLRKAFLDSVCTALGVLILTKLVSCG